MLPVLASPYLVNHREAYTKLFSYLGARKLAAKFSYLYNLLGGQFGKMRFLPPEKRRPVDIPQNMNRMVHVLLASGQLKILHSRIVFDAIYVIDFYARWDGTVKSLIDKPVNPEQLAFAGQAGAWVSRIIASCFQNMAAQAAYSSKATDIAPRKSLDRLPKFGRMLLRHLDSFQSRCLEPLVMFAHHSGSFPFYHEVPRCLA